MYPTVNLTGKKYGKWTVEKRAESSPKHGQAYWQIRCECGTTKRISSHHLRHAMKAKDCGCSRNLVGKRFGKLTVIEKSNGGSTKFKCKCDCGQYRVCLYCRLVDGKILSCGCLGWGKTAEERGPVQIYGYYKASAKRRNIEFTLTKEEFRNLLISNCTYCGRLPSTKSKITHVSKKREVPFFTYNGVDRKDNKQGYTSENSVTCCETCNLMKRQMTLEEWTNQMNRILDYLQSRQLAQLIKNGNNQVEQQQSAV